MTEIPNNIPDAQLYGGMAARQKYFVESTGLKPNRNPPVTIDFIKHSTRIKIYYFAD